MQADLEAQEKQPLIERGADGEYEDTRGKNNQHLLTHQKQMLREQDNQLDTLSGVVQGIKYENQNFNTEVTDQNKMLGKLNTDIDRTHRNMIKVDSRLKELIAKSNQTCLWIIIIIEIIVLILLIVV